jgi:hypothetical protein
MSCGVDLGRRGADDPPGYLLKGKPMFLWNLLNLKRVRWEGSEALTPGKHPLEYDFTYDGHPLGFNNISGLGRSGTGTFKVDGNVASIQKLDGRCRSRCHGRNL